MVAKCPNMVICVSTQVKVNSWVIIFKEDDLFPSSILGINATQSSYSLEVSTCKICTNGRIRSNQNICEFIEFMHCVRETILNLSWYPELN